MGTLFTLLFWCGLLLGWSLAFPLVLVALALWPIAWLLSLPLRLLGMAIGAG